MKIGCVYTVERGATASQPLPFAMDIPFGMGIIATVLKRAGHDVRLLVFSPRSSYAETLREYIETERPTLLCLTAVSSQFSFIRRIAEIAKEIDPSLFVVLGGHHASLNPDDAILAPTLDAICVGEGDHSVVALAECLEKGDPVTGIPHLWIKQPDGTWEKNPPLEFDGDLDSLPYIDREIWEPWVEHPDRYPSVLLGRGCPFRCTYCSAHAMARLSKGRFVRFRSPENICGEIDQIAERYPEADDIYLEVETIAHQKEAIPLFEKLEEFNAGRERKLRFGLNFTVTSVFIRDEAECRKFLEMLNRANVVYLNIGLESGSERLRKEVLRRPRYTNEEFIRFSRIAREYGVALDFYVLIGVPGETLADYKETVRLVRDTNPKTVQLSIFYPYLGTDLATIALERELVSRNDLDKASIERAQPALDLPGFSRRRVKLEYSLFWFKAFRGHWPASKIAVETLQGIVSGSPRLWARYTRIRENSKVFAFLRDRYQSMLGRREGEASHRPSKIEFTYSD
jgi:radical SAM superfamily enzyme YgiQ (UPF0313 family)